MPATRDALRPAPAVPPPSVPVEDLPAGVKRTKISPPRRNFHAPSRDKFEFAWLYPAPVRCPWLRVPWLYKPTDEERACVNCAQPYPCAGADEPVRRGSCQY